MIRIFALNRGRLAFYDPVSGVHLTVRNPVSPQLDDTKVNVSRLERAVRLGTLVDISPKPEDIAKALETIASNPGTEKDQENAPQAAETAEAAQETKKSGRSKKTEKAPESE